MILKHLKEVMKTIIDESDEDLYSKTQEELEKYWFFKFNTSKSLETNIYEFHEKLELYKHFCRQWEEHHNGPVCVVGRVRDKYLWNKIESFAKEIKHYKEAK